MRVASARLPAFGFEPLFPSPDVDENNVWFRRGEGLGEAQGLLEREM
jgi:hypothetical protein